MMTTTRWLQLLWVGLAWLAVATACGPVVIHSPSRPTATITAQVTVAGFKTQAAAKTLADVHHYVIEVIDTSSTTVVASQQTTVTTVQVDLSTNGTFQMRAEAFNSANVSITKGGPTLGSNTVTVNSSGTTYSSGSALAATLQLADGTGELLPNGSSLVAGTAWSGPAVGAAWQEGQLVSTTSVGTGPDALAMDHAGNVWVANDMSANLSKVSPAGVTLATISAGINPFAIAVDGLNKVWVVDRVGNAVLKFDTSGVLQGSVAVAADPRGIAFDSVGNAWVTSNGTTSLTKVTPGLSVAATYTMPATTWDITFDTLGNAWVTHNGSGAVSKVSSAGTVLTTVNVGTAPEGIRVDAAGTVWVANAGSNSVQRLTAAGTVSGTTTVNQPESLAFGPDGNTHVACNDGNVVMLQQNGTVVGAYPMGSNLSHILIDAAGNAWLADWATNRVYQVEL